MVSKTGSPQIINIDDLGTGTTVEQLLLGLEIGVHVRVIVEMVWCQIREGRDRKLGCLDPVLIERMGADLECNNVDTLINKRTQQALKIGTFGSRMHTP